MFRIGEFSRIAQVSGRLLRYYDEIGLLSPSYTDSQTGYRYYNAQQLPQLNRILVLKELGLSLEQIAQLLEQNTSDEEMRGMLTLRKVQIEQTLQEEMTRLRMIESRLEQINKHGQILEPDIVLKSVERQTFLAVREVFPDMGAVQRLVREINSVAPTHLSQNALGPIAVIIHTPIYEPQAFDLEIGFTFTGTVPDNLSLPHERTLTARELPAVETMATVVHVGSVEHRHRGYAALAFWLQHNGYHIDGVGREILMQLPVGTEENIVMELQLPVTKRAERLGA